MKSIHNDKMTSTVPIGTIGIDVINRNEVVRSININLSLGEIENLISERPRFETFFKDKYEKLLSIIYDKQFDEWSEELIQRAIQNSLMKYPEGTTINEKMIDEIIQELTKKMIPLIASQNKAKNKE